MALERKLVGLEFDRGGAELRGLPLSSGGRILGRVTSAAYSPSLETGIGLGWIRRGPDGSFPEELRTGRAVARVVRTPFYDPEGARLRV
jgi:glycine cleavage system aminomethyltransferase T